MHYKEHTMRKKLINFNTGTIRFDYFRNMVLTAVLFMTLLFVGTSGVFLYNSFALKSDDSLHQLNYISRQLQYYLTSVDNYSRTILSDTQVQNYMVKYRQGNIIQQDTLDVRQQICQIIQSTSFIHSVRLYSSEGTYIVASESFSYAEDLKSTPEYSQWTTGVRTKVGSANEQLKVVSYTRPFYEISSGSLLGYIEISIPESEISSIYSGQRGGQDIFMVDSEGAIQSADDPSVLDNSYPYGVNIPHDSESGYFFAGTDLVFYRYFPMLDWYIISQIPLGLFLSSILLLFGISLIIAVVIMAVCIYVSQNVARRVTSPLSHLVSHIQKVKKGTWEPIDIIPCNEEISTLFHSFNSMITTQSKMRDDLIQAEKLKRQLSLSLLQEQVNPHFLYNTLDNICSLAEIDETDTLIRLTMSLSSFYRSSLSKGKMHITVKEELEISRSYLEIMQIRYFNKFDYTISCPKTLEGCQCIKLLLQPVIENSIYHGIKELPGHGRISVLVEEKDSAICFTIEDNGKGFSDSDYSRLWSVQSGHFGIKNIHQRIQLYYGSQYGLTIHSKKEGGCVTVITIPKEKEEK